MIHVKISHLTIKKRQPFHPNGTPTKVRLCILSISRNSCRPSRSQTVEERIRSKYKPHLIEFRPHMISKMEPLFLQEDSVCAVSQRTLSRQLLREKSRTSLSSLTSVVVPTTVSHCFLRSIRLPRSTHLSLVNARYSSSSISMEISRYT